MRNNAKPKHKSSIQSGGIKKLDQYFMEGQNKDGIWKNAEKLVEFICFRCVFILLAVAERDGGSLQDRHLKQKLMTLEPVTYVQFGLVY